MDNQKLELIEQSGKNRKRLGIVGGMGSEASCNFCLNVTNRIKELTNCQPDILLENLPVSAKAESGIINGEISLEIKSLLSDSIADLNNLNSDLIVIPCNTVHVFIDELRSESKAGILSIIEETAKECSKNGFKKIGMVASETTVNQKLHENELKKFGIETVLPDSAEQKTINGIILKILRDKGDINDKKILLDLIKKLKSKDADAVMLGCTDLSSLISQEESDLPLVDTLKILEKRCVEVLLTFINAGQPLARSK